MITKFVLNQVDSQLMKDMLKWAFEGDKIVYSINSESFTIVSRDSVGEMHQSVNTINLLLFVLAPKLGMKHVMINIQNPNDLFKQIYDTYVIFKNIQETVEYNNEYFKKYSHRSELY